MQEFRADLQEYLQAKHEFKELKEYADREYMMGYFDVNAGEAKAREIVNRMQDWRAKVARRLVEATGISTECGIPTQLVIVAPPAIGGAYKHTLSLYNAAIQDELPYGYELPREKLADAVDQTIFACERQVTAAQEGELNPPSPLKKVPGAVGKGFGALFKTETDKAILKWAIIVLIVVIILRLLGVPVQKIGEMLSGWFKK